MSTSDMIIDNNKIPSIRMPHDGQCFELMDTVFTVKKSKGFKFKAEAKKDKEPFQLKDGMNKFTLMGTKFHLQSFNIKDGKIKIGCSAI